MERRVADRLFLLAGVVALSSMCLFSGEVRQLSDRYYRAVGNWLDPLPPNPPRCIDAGKRTVALAQTPQTTAVRARDPFENAAFTQGGLGHAARQNRNMDVSPMMDVPASYKFEPRFDLRQQPH
jgi:hypothetical protein